MDVVRDWGAVAVVTLMEEDELEYFQIARIVHETQRRFMEWFHLPIVDGAVPCARFETGWPDVSRRLRGLLEAGNRVFVHCRGGLGRAGTISARLLVEMGMDAEEAIRAVRAARSPHAIENPAQEAWVRKGRREPVVSSSRGRRDRALGALVGLAVGDAVGTTIEFTAKPEAPVLHDMIGGGPFGLEAGQFTDDTSMAIALADSLIHDPSLDPIDLMDRFVSWRDSGAYSCTGRCFDIGSTTSAALSRYLQTGNPFAGSTDPQSSGNGCIMRLAPVAIRHWREPDELARIAAAQSRTTHASDECVACSVLLARILADAIGGAPAHELTTGSAAMRVRGYRPGQPREAVRGSGYVVAGLHAALWAVSRTSSFESAVLTAANLGEDADTTAAVAGQIAGAIYGLSGIPERWLARLAWRDEIEAKAALLFDATACGGSI